MAIWYLYHHPLHQARNLIKEGIKNYNLAQGGANSDTEGYHETITEFYIQIIAGYLSVVSLERGFADIVSAIDEEIFLEKSFPFQYYTREVLFSKQARLHWVSPNVKPILSYRRSPEAA